MEINLAAAYWSLDEFRSWDLPQIACEALQQGFDSPGLRMFARERDATMATAGPMFEAAIREIGIPIPSEHWPATI